MNQKNQITQGLVCNSCGRQQRQEQGIPFDKSTLPAHPADSDSGEFDTVEEALGYLYTCLHCPDSVLC